jgi:type IV secretion system protein VirD4
VLFGPNGSGKSRRILATNLLTVTDRSMIVLDPKGELANISAAYRSEFSRVVILDPFGASGLKSSGFNPLASLDRNSRTFLDDAAGLAEAIVPLATDEKERHWSDSARALIQALIMWEVIRASSHRQVPLLENVRWTLTQAPAFEEIDGHRTQVAGLGAVFQKIQTLDYLELESLIGRFVNTTTEMTSVHSVADRETHWLLSTPMQESLSTDEIDFRSLKEKLITVYVILPAERMQTHSAWLRLVIVTALRCLYSIGGLRTLIVMDEFAQLGRLRPIEEAFGLVRGYGVQLWPVLQDLNQLKSLYERRWETFMANAGIVQTFGVNDLTTAEWVSRRAGEKTILAGSYSQSKSTGQGGTGRSENISHQQMQRRLFMPQDLFDIPEGAGLIFPAGSAKPIPFFADFHFNVPELKGRAACR